MQAWLERIRKRVERTTALFKVRFGRHVRGLGAALPGTSDLPEDLHYYIEIPAEPGQLRELLEGDPLVYPLEYPLAQISVLLHPEPGESTAARLHFEVTARSPLPVGLMLRLYDHRIRTELEHLSNHLYFRCLASGLTDPGWSPRLIQSGDFPSLDTRNFRQPGRRLHALRDRMLGVAGAAVDYPARDYFYHYPLQPGYPQTVELEEVLLISMALPESELESLIPPPFRLSSFAPAALLLCAAREVAVGTAGRMNQRPALRWELRAPVQLLTRSNYLHGWLPLEACRVPLDRPRLPGDDASGSLRRYEEGLRFCAGGARQKMHFHAVYRPRRGLVTGDGLPEILSGENRVFLQSPESLDITVLREEPLFAVNHIRVAVDETRTFEHHHNLGAFPDPAAHYGAHLGVSLAAPNEALYLSRLTSRLAFDFHVPLRQTNYRAYAARTSPPRS